MRGVLVCLAAFCLVAPAAGAATVGPDPQSPRDLWFRAEPGERNDLTIVQSDDGIRFRDDGARVVPTGRPCEAVSPSEVFCQGPRGWWGYLRAETGDGDDRARSDGMQIRLGAGDDVASGPLLFGEDGDDELSGASLDGAAGNDTLLGTPGADGLAAGPGRDTVVAGDGDDTLQDGDGAHSDVLDGGAGNDRLDYGSRSAPLVVDLVRDVAGAQGEEDRIPAIEAVSGGAGDDVLLGDDGANSLFGALGDDVLRGAGGDDSLAGHSGADEIDGGAGVDRLSGDAGRDRLLAGAGDDDVYGGGFSDVILGDEGNDVIVGGAGADSLDAGPGDDTFEMEHDHFRDRIRCGDGRDRGQADRGDAVEPDCEVVERRRLASLLSSNGRLVRGRRVLEARGRTLFVSVPCPDHCLGRLVLRLAGRLAVRATWRCADEYEGVCVGHTPPSLTVRLPRWAARRLVRRRRAAGRVTMTFVPGGIPSTERILLVPRR
jgi:Ca2+-binding RTX toxin-like protein